MLARAVFSALLFAGSASAASTDIFAYTDSTGVTHFTNVPTDKHFRLIAKGPVEPPPVARAGNPRPKDWAVRVGTYSKVVDRAAQRSAVQPALLLAVIAVESAFDPLAVSPVGAQGLMQLLPGTARRYGVGDAFDPEQNVGAGAKYLSDLLRRYNNNLELALAAYNAGENAVDRYGQRVPPYLETRAYVPAVLKMYRQFLKVQAS